MLQQVDVDPKLPAGRIYAITGQRFVYLTLGQGRARRYGIAVGEDSCDGRVPGIDQSSFAGEVWALWVLMRALRGLRCNVTVLIDNKSVCEEAQAWAWGTRSKYGNVPGIWRRIRDAMDEVRGIVECA